MRRVSAPKPLAGKLGVGLAVVSFLAGEVHALDPNKRLTQYMHNSWRIQDGSIPSGMQSISQTSDGFLWFASSSGDVYRFDGVRFVPSPTHVKGGSVTNVFGDHQGALWAFSGIDAVRMHAGVVTSRFDLRGILLHQNISEAADGSLWVVRADNAISDKPLCHFTDDGAECFGKANGVPISPVDSLLADGLGGFWLGGQTTLVHWRAGVSEVYPIEGLRSNAGQNGIGSLALASDGTLWVGIRAEGRGLGLGRLIGKTVKPFMTPTFDGSKVEVKGLVFDRDGNLWVATASKGILRIHGNIVDHYEHTEGLSGDSVDAVFADREGIVWAATTNGVDSFRDPRVTAFSAMQGLKQDAAVGVLASKDGTIWVANAGSLDRIVNGAVLSIRKSAGLPGDQVSSMLEDHAGNMWVGVDDGLYLFRNGRFRRLPEPKHQPLGLVVGMTEDVNGNIWAECVGNPRKLVRIRDFQVREEYYASQVPAGHTLAPSPQGGIWIGTLAGEILLFRNGIIETRFPLNPGGEPLSWRIVAQVDGSVLASSENGLVGWRQGKVQRMTKKNGLPCDTIVSFIEDKEERWWIYTACGVVELTDSDLKRWWANPNAVVLTTVYDVLDGARPPGRPPFNSAALSPDGRVWFASAFVVEMIDPSGLSPKAIPAMTYIESVTVDRKEFKATGGVTLAPHPRDVRIDYTSPTFLIPQKVKFRYRLDPYDRDWNDAGTRRQAFYTDLAPGKYTFRLIACNSAGSWNDRAAKLDFSIAPAYYQTNWFRALCGGFQLLLLWSAYQWRVRQLHEQFAMTLDARIAERTRIARELHDTLLQSAHGVLLRFETVSQLLDERPADAKLQLKSAIQQTADFITEARDEVQGLRDSTDENGDLAAEINSLGDALASDSANNSSTTFYVTVEGEARPLNPILRDDIYKICAEALRNAFQHSGAKRVEVEIRYDHYQFRLRVRDDGKGIDQTILSSPGAEGHYGLRGMRERAILIGGNLTVWSKVDEGTELELRVPEAYSTAQRRWLFPRKRKR